MLHGAHFLLATCRHEAAAGRPMERLGAWTPPFTRVMPMCPLSSGRSAANNV